ncbi:uncharacterized protein LOC128895770 [Hylaeus anthracinus]|uniref:uncharacterized protein LOC128895770 n=1 Tax=Hylaeus anthracinus TaxID=313031 RepID=UPI0023B9634C|nr:uncharacterized protein LOC128895770 [Hylaeus anthracinus]XP_054014634.1 uncharacterized protein LOC128895770 [Hylaeus anthracinus]XP_054014635.1 uncharacterized protein LOC128895770 [Hylaeus anthracinus]XP_054014637.1 uncharacterized protein LOC128895770 [Hylaeus anthracinus]
MEKIKHLWNVNQFVTKLSCPERMNLQTFYIQKCRRLSKGMQLPSRTFGPAAMCQYCGTLWNTADYNIRISHGKPLSKSIGKVLLSMNDMDKRIPKVRRSLATKCLKNNTNKLVFKCSVCLESTKVPFNKPQRKKGQKATAESIQTSQRRKKKKSRDKTAGLNISGISNLSIENIVEGSKETSTKKVKSTTNFITPIQKIKKLNINRLKDVVNHGATPSKRRSLHSFLTELC